MNDGLGLRMDCGKIEREGVGVVGCGGTEDEEK